MSDTRPTDVAKTSPKTVPLSTNAAPVSTTAPMSAALVSATKAALIVAGLAFPILAYRAEPDFSNTLVLQNRWSWLVIAAALAFIARFASAIMPTRAPLAKAASLIPARVRNLWPVIVRFFVPFALAALFAFPLVMLYTQGPAAATKWIDNYGIQILIYVMLAWGLNIVVGLAGLLDLGYVAFYAVGAYAYAILSTTFGLSFWICLPLAGILAAFWGVILGFPVLRLRGDYLAIVTLAFGEIIRIVLLNWTDVTKGDAGISSIPQISFFGLPFKPGAGGFAAFFDLKPSPIYATIFLFYLIALLALLTNAVTVRLRRLPIGRAWEALREDEIACRSLGINTVSTKLTAFSLGAMFGGFAGSFFAVRQGFVSPSSFNFLESATILALVVLGGRGSQIGTALAATFIIGGSELLRELEFLKQIFGPNFDPTQYRMLLVGLAMVVMMNWKPRGLVATRTPTIFLGAKRTYSADLVKEGHG
jgi:branched-chain amino acid transport system permease protein